MTRLPKPGSDNGNWGDILNDYLLTEHNADGSLKLRSDGTVANFYTKPAGGILRSDLSSETQTLLEKADGSPQEGDSRLTDARLTVQKSGTDIGTEKKLNLIESPGLTLTASNNVSSQSTDVTVHGLTSDTLITSVYASGGEKAGLWFPKKYDKSPPLPSSIITTFQSGHGWAANGTSAVTVTSDTSIYTIGSQSMKMTVTSSTSTTQYARSPDNLGLNFTGKSLELVFRLNNASRITSTLQLQLTSDGTNYFGATLYPGGIGYTPDWFRVILSQKDFSSSLNWASIRRMRIRMAGTAGHTVELWANRLALIPNPTFGPVVSFTFDDTLVGDTSVYVKKLGQYGYPATCYLITDRFGASSSYMTLAGARELQDTHGWQMAAHAVSHADHDSATLSSDIVALERSFLRLKENLAAMGFNGGDDFALGPYTGRNSSSTMKLIKKYFRSCRTALGGLTYNEQVIPTTPHLLVCKMWLNEVSTAATQALIDKCVANNTWLILLFHGTATTSSGLSVSSSDFFTIVDYVYASGAKVMTVGDVLDNASWYA